MFIQYLTKPVSLDYLQPWLEKGAVKVLDVGCGNHSPSKFKSHFPKALYYGLDQSKDYNLDQTDLGCMEKFFEINLAEAKNLDILPNNFFDGIILSHIIEHLPEGEAVVEKLILKLRKDGVIYMEFPHPRTIHFPSAKGKFRGGCLNFYDDPSHVRMYLRGDLEKLLTKNGCRIIKSGRRCSWKRIFFFPVYLFGMMIRYQRIDGGAFWDIMGFADFIVAQKVL